MSVISLSTGNAASINGLCVTPKEFGSRLGQYGHYCPVRLMDHAELVDCSSQDSFKYSVQYKGYYYRFINLIYYKIIIIIIQQLLQYYMYVLMLF